MSDYLTLTNFPHRLIVTGPSGSGKTTCCRRVIASARAAGWQVGGMLSLPRFEAGRKTGIVALDLSSGEQRLLASRQPAEIAGLPFGQWTFAPTTLTWGNAVLEHLPPCDLLIVDELGPLEFDLHQGWTAGLQALLRPTHDQAMATVRPAYLARLQASWPDSIALDVAHDALDAIC